MTESAISKWVRSYQLAWTSNDPDDIRALFTANAEYYTAPFRSPWRGHQAIVSGWIERADQPEDWDFRSEILLESPELNLVRGWTTYREPPRSYSNLWIVRLGPDGRCRQFTEWWMLQDDNAE
jgi:hypothetical protein